MKKDIKMDQPLHQQPSLEKRNIFKSFILNPLGWLSIAISVVGIILTVYSREVAELCVSISSDKNIIFRKGENSKLKILYEGRKISSDITSTQMILWNNGKKSIRPSNILSPVYLVIPKTEILDAILIKESRPIIKTQLNTEYQKKGIVGISWDILEKGDGCKIQLIYTGGPDIPIKTVGAIEGQKSINTQKGKFLALSKSAYWQSLIAYLLYAIVFIFFCFCVGSMIKETSQSRKLSSKKIQKKIMTLVLLIVLLFLILIVCFCLRRCLLLKMPLEWIS
jgi:hypothetical protein